MKIDHLKLYANEKDWITGINKILNELGGTIKNAEKRKPTEKEPIPAAAILLVNSKGEEIPLLMYSSNPAFYEALAMIDDRLAFDKENPKYKGINKHLVFIHKLAELGFYVYRAYKKDKLETTHSKNGGYLVALQHPNLSPIHYEIPKDEIKEECLTSLVHLRAKTQAE